MKIGFIGAGQMAQALAAGIAAEGNPIEFLVHDPSKTARQSFTDRIDAVQQANAKILSVKTNSQVLAESKIVFLAIKPQQLTAALADVNPAETSDGVVLVSILAGVSVDKIQEQTGAVRIVRAMPNTPCLIGSGAIAIAGAGATDKDMETVESLLATTGLVQRVDEGYLDAVTGLSGSGPAFVFTFIQSMIDGAVLAGLARPVATRLALQTVLGSTELAIQSGEYLGVLRDRVTSPGGTTIAGLKTLEENGFRDAVMSAVQSATLRSRELGRSAD